jgi:hypothetical protein
MMMLRVIAVAIAIAGLADPVITVSRERRPPLTVAIIDSPSLALSDGQHLRREAAYRSAEILARELRDELDVAVRDHPVNSAADPCPTEGPCVIVSSGARPRTL